MKFLRVDVQRTRIESSELYLEVADDFDPEALHRETVRRACQESIRPEEWVSEGPAAGEVEAVRIRETTEAEARKFKVFAVGEGA